VASSPPTFTGLTSAEVNDRVARGETNAFKARVGRTYLDILRDNLFNLFNIVLGTLLIIVLLFHDYATVFFAGFSVVSNSLLGMFQEVAAKRKLDQLAALQVKEARVYRDGKLTNVPIDQIVKDDLIALEPGERLVVDGKVVHTDSLEMDESQLTGESDAVLKDKGDPVFSGSFAVAGTGVIVATAVGKQSKINQLSDVAKAYKNVLTPTQQKITTLVQISVVVMAVVGPMVFVSGYLNHLPALEMFRNAVVFVTSLVPQGLVLSAILSLTIGAITISRNQTLVQRVNAVESLANVTVLCFDKTGTLTRNQLAVTEIIPLDGMASEEVIDALHTYVGNLAHQNKTAAAVAAFTQAHLNGRSGAPIPVKRLEIPFTSARKWGAIVLPDETLIFGAPERVLGHGGGDEGLVAMRAQQLASEGLRVLALARSTKPPTDGTLDDARKPVALIVLSDQVRDNIQQTLDSFTAQGVALKVISGDNAETVKAIASQAGMDVSQVYTGAELEAMDEAELETAAEQGSVFARIEPDTKRKLLAALKRRGHYTAMVGDGVNDVPALKEANLAVVMNDGAQIAKDVGDIVLLNNAMSTLPLAFKEGRAITQTIFGTSRLFLVKNLFSLLFFIFAGFMSMPFPINPIQISWVTFGIINVPATLIAFRLLVPNYMARFRQDVLDYVINAGVIGAAAMALLYGTVYMTQHFDQNLARSAITVFLTMYGALVLWHTHGIEILRPQTVRPRIRVFLLGLVLAIITVGLPYLLPSVLPAFDESYAFVHPSPLVWILITCIFILAMIVLEVAVRTRAFVSRIWSLAER
jgi:cation-transporting P-type ATPase E